MSARPRLLLRTLAACPEMWGLLALGAVFGGLRPVLSRVWPAGAVLGSTVLYLLPGAAFCRLLGRREAHRSWLEWLAHSFAASFVLLALPTLAVILLRRSLDALVLAYAVLTGALTLAAIVVAVLRSLRDQARWRTGSTAGWLLRLTPYVATLLLAWLAAAPVQAKDDWFVLGYIQDDLVTPHINAEDPFFNAGLPMHPRYRFSPWLVEEALLVRFSGLHAIDWYNGWIVVLVVVAMGAYYAAGRELLPAGGAAAFGVGVVGLYLAATIYPDQAGWDFLPRIAEDKMVARYILMPLAFAPALAVLRPGRRGRGLAAEWREWTWLLVTTQALGMIHPEGVVFLGLPLTACGLLELYFTRRRETVLRLIMAAAVVLSGLILPVVQFASATGPPDQRLPPRAHTLNDARDPLQWAHLSHSFGGDTRLWLYADGSFSVHPSRFLKGFAPLAYLGVAGLIFRLRKSRAARFFVGTFLLITVVLLFPPTARLLALFITPWLLHRLVWPLDSLGVPFVLAWGAWALMGALERGWLALWAALRRLVPRRWASPRSPARVALRLYAPLAVPLAALLLLGRIRVGLAGLVDKRQSTDSCPALAPIFGQLARLTPTHTTVLVTSRLSDCIPGYAPYADVVAYQDYGTIGLFPIARGEEARQRVEDTQRFSAATLVDRALMDSIARWGVGYLVLKLDAPLETQLRHLPELFERAAEGAGYVIYAYRPRAGASADGLIAANGLLSGLDAGAAAGAYERLLEDEHRSTPGQRYLAWLGLGQARLALGDREAAQAAFEAASRADPHDAWARIRLGEVRTLAHDCEGAVEQYQRAVELRGDIALAWQRLGDAHQACGRPDAALEAYRAAAGTQYPVGSSRYEQAIGDALAGVGRHREAIAAYERVLDIVLDSGALQIVIAQQKIAMQDWRGAERTLRDVTRLRPWDTWSASAYDVLGDLYAMRGDFVRAEAAYRTSLWLDPTADYAGLTSLWHSRLGATQALARLARLPGYRHGFIPALAAMADVRASVGDYDAAVREIRRALTLDPLSADLLLQIAAHEMARGDLDMAQALSTRASALGGYGAYSRLGDLALERGQARSALGLYWLAQLASPSSGAPLLAAANAYVQLGDIEGASVEYRLAATGPLSTAVALQALGTFQRGRGDLTGALNSLAAAAEMEPGSPGIQVALANTYQLAGRTRDARAAYQRAVELGPGLGSNRAALASFLVTQGEVEAALEQLEQSAALDPGYVPGQTALANLYVRSGQSEAARALLERLIEGQPHAADGYLALGMLQEQAGQPEAAAATYRLGLARVAVARSAPLRVALGGLEQRRGRPERALRYFEAAAEASPAAPDGFVRLADWYARGAQWTKATSVLERALARTPGSVALWDALGDLQATIGAVSAAEECYARALELDPSSAEARVSLAALYGGLGDAAQARAELEAAAATWPGGVWALPPLASWQRLSGEPGEALLSARQAITLAPGDSGTWLGLAGAYQALGQLDQARAAYQQAGVVEPNSAEIWVALAAFERSQGRLEEAEAALRRAAQVNAASNAAIVTLGDLLRQQGRWAEAEDAYRQAVAVDVSQSAGYLGLAGLLQSRGRMGEAETVLREAIRALPADVSLHVALAGVAAQQAQFELAEEALACAARRGACREGDGDASPAVSAEEPRPAAAAGWLALGQLLLGRGRQAEAEQAFQRAVSVPGEATAGRIALGDLYMMQGRRYEALEQYQRAVDGARGDPLGQVALVGYYGAMAEWETARSVFERAFNACPGCAALYGAESAYLLGRGEPEAALEAARRAVALERTAAILVTLGQAHERLVHYAEAERAYAEAAALDRSLPDGPMALGGLFSRLGRTAEAEAAYLAAIEAAPSSPEGHLSLARHYQAQAQPQAALEQLGAAERVAPAAPATHVALGDAYALLGQVEEAELAYQRAVLAAPGDISGYAAVGQLYLSRGNWDRAREVYSAAIELAPADPAGYLGLGQTLQMQGQSDAALMQVQKAARHAPASALAFRRLGDLYRLRGQVDDAEHAYEQATLASPGDPAGYTALASLALGGGERATARLWARRAIEVSPAAPDGYLALAQVEALDGDPSGALQAFEAATQVAPVASATHVQLGDWHWLRGEIPLAERAFAQAISVAPGDPDGYLGLGRLYSSQGRFPEALAQFERAAAVAPAYVAAHIERGNWHEARGEVQAAEAAFVDAVVAASMSLEPLTATQSYSMALSGALRAWLETPPAEGAPALEEFTARFGSGDPSGLVALAQLYQTQGRPVRAERALLLATAVAPASIGSRLGLGSLYQAHGRAQEALAQFRAAVELAPTSAQAHVELGDWHRQRGDDRSAEQEYLRAIAATAGGGSDVLLSLLYRWQEPAQPEEWVEQTAPLGDLFAGAGAGLTALGELELSRRDFAAAARAYSQTIAAAPLAPDGYLGLAELHTLLGNRGAAEEQLATATRQSPGSLEAYLALGDWYAEQGQAAAAEAAYRRAQALAPGNSQSLLGLGALALAQGDRASARQYIEDALRVAPADPSAAIALGDLARAAGDYPGAEQAYRRAVAAAPGEDSGYLALARQLERQGDRASAAEVLRQAVAVAPTVPAGHVHLAAIYRALGQMDAAQAQLLRAVELSPISALPRVALGALYESQADREAALAQYARAVALEPDSIEAYGALVAAYSTDGRLGSARAAAEQAIGLNPGSAWPELLLGELLAQQGSAGEALAAYERAVAKEPANIEALGTLGWAYHLRGRVSDAMTLYRRAVALQPGNVSARLAMARGYFAESRIEEAQQEYETAIALDASAVGSYSALAGHYSARNQLYDSLATYRRAQAAAPLDTAPILDGARVLGQLGDWEAALAECQRAAELDRSSALPQLVIGQLYRDIFDYGQAVQAFERGAAVEPGNMELYTSLASLFTDDRHRSGDEALAQAQRALALGFGSALAHTVMGEVLEVRFGNLPGAIAEYEQALRLDPRESDAYERMVDIYQRDLDDLLARYSPSSRAESEWPWIYGLMAHAYKVQDNVEACIAAYETMLTMVPDYVQAHCDVAALYERLNRQGPALRHWGLCAALAAEGQGALVAESRRERISTIAIASPSQGQVVGGVVEIWGSAAVPDAADDRYDFQFYKVEIGAGAAPTSWAAIGDVVRQPVVDGVLAVLDTTALPNGLYTLRLTVVDNVGNTWPSAEVQVTVRN